MPSGPVAKAKTAPARGSKRAAEGEHPDGAEPPPNVSRALEDIPSNKRPAEESPEQLKDKVSGNTSLDELLDEWGIFEVVEKSGDARFAPGKRRRKRPNPGRGRQARDHGAR